MHDLEDVEHSSYSLLVRLPQVAATSDGFVLVKGVRCVKANSQAQAAILKDGTVRSWGSALYGGDSEQLGGALREVLQLQASSCAFAALRKDGQVVTWGHKAWGGDCEAVREELPLGKWRSVAMYLESRAINYMN